MNFFKKFFSILLCVTLVFSLCACGKTNTTSIDGLFDNVNKISYATSYTELKAHKTNKTKSWRQGMVVGDGLQGAVIAGSPYSDTMIFQNMHFIMPNDKTRNCPNTVDELENVKQSIVKGENITDNANYDEVYYYHPGGELRIEQNKNVSKNYVRYTNYESGEVGVRYTDTKGTWQRTTFTSKSDDITITKIAQSDNGKKVNLTLSYDDMSAMANYGDGDEVNTKYKRLVSDDLSTISFIGHYPNYKNSELKNGGWATVTYVINVGGKKTETQGRTTEDKQYATFGNPEIQVSNADEVYLLTVSGRTDSMGSLDDFSNAQDYQLIDDLTQDIKKVITKYSNESDAFDYDAALNAHKKIYQEQFDAVELTLGDEVNDQSNEELLKAQKGEDSINSALAQRTYYQGRFAYLCCAGYSTSRLYGMWTGEFNTGWGSKYTMDANVNLQTSSMNTSNLSSAPIGYANFILRQVDDWEENALNTHGYTDAIQAPVNTDGDCAVINETCYSYPFRYWNAGASWMLEPLYETLQTYGDIQIPLSDEFDLSKLKSVLSTTETDLTDKDIQKIKDKGYLDLEEDILLPVLIKSCNYWDQLMSPEYYTDKDGAIHYEKGKTELKDGETYAILPSYSPENNPSNYESPSDANCAIDISACKNNIEMLLRVVKDTDSKVDTSKYEDLYSKIPPYLYDETGALKEWATTSFEENNEHRHLSHLYLAWPLNETQDKDELRNACIQAVENRESENEASHALVHRSLIAARLKDRDSLTDALLNLMNHKIRYNSLMTNHDYDQGSAYCTDFCIGYLGIVNESLVYSNEGEIQVLPALPTSGFDKGEIKGLEARTQATIDSLKWDTTTNKVSVTITSKIDQKIKVSCYMTSDSEKEVQFKANEPQTFEYTINK